MDAVELDEAGNIIAEYNHAGEGEAGAVVAVAVKDSLQAFSSSIAGLLSSRAVLQGVGVGDSSASATSAVLLTILQDSLGRLATILFAWRFGTSLEPECKRYRLAADLFNDTGLVLECLSPALPKPIRVATLCFAGCMRALCGVAAGGAKASLSVHFAKWGNVGELNAKDSSQETVISLMGMLAGSLVVSRITSVTSTWLAMLFLVGIHLYTNYRAVRAVTMRTLNRQRANIALSHFYTSAVQPRRGVLSPKEVAVAERIFEFDGLLRFDGRRVGYGLIGCKLSVLISSAGAMWRDLCELFKEEEYILWYIPRQRRFVACLKAGCSPQSQLKAWTHGLLLARDMQKHKTAPVHDILRQTKTEVDGSFSEFVGLLEEAGWDVDGTVLETVSGYRVRLMDGGKKIK